MVELGLDSISMLCHPYCAIKGTVGEMQDSFPSFSHEYNERVGSEDLKKP
jgi:hypothetical protein